MVHVAVGVIVNSQQQVLIALRPSDRTLAGFWEFPGGKIEASESVFDALKRELHEEIGITILEATPFLQTQHRYTQHEVLLNVWQVNAFSGEPHGREGQQIAWAKVNELFQYKFPDANQIIIEQLIKNSNS